MSCAFYSLHMLLMCDLLAGEYEDGGIAEIMMELQDEENK